jgi:phospholipid/cholesterol/gamma-HCH transport system permease protein
MSLMIAQLGQKCRVMFGGITETFRFASISFRAFLDFQKWNRGASFRVIMDQVRFTGLEAMPSITLISLILGFIVIVQALPVLLDLGANQLIGKILVIAIVREFGPLLTAMVVICRSGTAIAAELAVNKVMGEIEVLESMGIDPFHYIVVPRMVGGAISVFCLTIYFELIALGGGFIVASLRLIMPFDLFVTYFFEALTMEDVTLSAIKSLIFGTSIPIICAYHGLIRTGRATFEVPMVARDGVIRCMFFIFLMSAVISAAFYLV